MLNYRLAKEEDLQNILNSYNATIPSRMATADLEPQSMEERMRWFDKHRDGSRPVWVIELDGHYVGWMSFSNFYGRPAYSGTIEFSMYLDEKYRGKGIGKQALEYAIAQAPSYRVHTLLAYIFGHNPASIALFESSGFTKWGHFPAVAVMDALRRDLLIFGKQIR